LTRDCPNPAAAEFDAACIKQDISGFVRHNACAPKTQKTPETIIGKGSKPLPEIYKILFFNML